MLNVHAKVPHLFNWKEDWNLAFVKNVNAGSSPTSVCMIVAEMNNKSLLNSGWIARHLQMKIYLNRVVLKTRFDHALDVVDKLEQDDLSQSGIP